MNTWLDQALTLAFVLITPIATRCIWFLGDAIRNESIAQQLNAQSSLLWAQVELEQLKRSNPETTEEGK
jgi:hypothetical protein